MTGEEKPGFWKNQKCATAFRAVVLCRQLLLNSLASSVCTGSWALSLGTEAKGSPLERRELRANLLKGLDWNTPPGVAELGKGMRSHTAALGQAAGGMWPAADQAPAVFDNTACSFWFPVKKELTVLLTFSLSLHLFLDSLSSFYSVGPCCFVFVFLSQVFYLSSKLYCP